MSSQWLILLTFISFLHLAVTGPLYNPVIHNWKKTNTNPNRDFTSNFRRSQSYIDTSYYYRLTNAYTGQNYALDVRSGNNYGMKMFPVSSHPGQFWRFVPLGDNVYSLRTLFQKNGLSLDIVNDGINTKPYMAKTGDYSGQRWHLTRVNDGTFKLSNEFTGNNMALDIYKDNTVAHMSEKNGDYSGQHWTFVKIQKIEDY